MVKQHIFKGMKFTFAALIAILIAEELQLQYTTTAGIITILSIQNTKLDTLRVAARRTLAFLCAICISYACYHLLGYNTAAFGVYLLCFSTLCFSVQWIEAIAMDSVLITHFLAEQSMGAGIMRNEIGLFVIGTAMGIIANSLLRKKTEEFNLLADGVDEGIKGVLHRMSEWLMKEDKSGYQDSCFASLERMAEKAMQKAYENKNNSYFDVSNEEVEYMEMRQKQILTLKHMYQSIKMLRLVPKQANAVSEIIATVVRDYDKENPVNTLLEELNGVFLEMKQEELPIAREEFENRAILYYIMKQLEELLLYKKAYMEARTRGIKKTAGWFGLRKEK